MIYVTIPNELAIEPITVCEILLADGSGAVATTPSFRVVSKEAVFSAEEILASPDFSGLLSAIARADDARITSSRIENDELIVTYADGTEVNLGNVKGPKGDDGYTPQKGVDYFDGLPGKDGATGPAGADGKDGVDGAPGKDGSVWHYGTAVTGNASEIMVPVAGAKLGDYYFNVDTGAVYVSVNGDVWWRYLITLKGKNGDNGLTPYIGENGNWFIGDVDTGVSAGGSGTGSSVELDTTLTEAGKAADAKAVGDAIASVMGAYVTDLATLIGGGA